MKVTWQIRQAISDDAIGLKNCMISAYAPYLDRMNGQRLPPMDVDYSFEIRNYPAWVVESDGSILGGLIMIFGNDYASIANIAVDPKYQGQGIGRELMTFAESKARENGVSELRLTTHHFLTENISLYRYLGWKEFGKDASKIFMKKKI